MDADDLQGVVLGLDIFLAHDDALVLTALSACLSLLDDAADSEHAIDDQIPDATVPMPVGTHSSWWDSLLSKGDSPRFQSIMRFKLPSFDALVELLRPRLSSSAMNSRLRFTAAENDGRAGRHGGRLLAVIDSVGLFVVRLAHGLPFRLLRTMFGIDDHTTAKAAFDHVLLVFADIFAPELLQWPNVIKRAQLAQVIPRMGVGDELVGFGGCIGLMDGTEIPIHRPTGPFSTQRMWFSGRTKTHCLKLELVLSTEGFIIHVVGGDPGSWHDAAVLQHSNFFLHPSQFFTPGEFLLCDKGYPLTDFTMPPYQSLQTTSESHLRFNERLAKIRIAIEWLNGHLKTRWAVFSRALRCGHAMRNAYILSACALSNFLFSQEGTLVSHYFPPVE